MLLVSFNLGVILIAAVLALTIIFIWACSWYFDLVPKPKGYVKLELDRDRVPLKIGSTFTLPLPTWVEGMCLLCRPASLMEQLFYTK